MSRNERTLDFHIGNLLRSAEIQFTPNGSVIAEINEALKTSSKKGTGRVGFPEFTAKSGDFILVIEDKADLNKQANYSDESETILTTDTKSITDFAENGALHYAKEIVAKTNFHKVFAFGCTGDEKHHVIRPIFVSPDGYKVLQSVENFENFAVENIEKYYRYEVLEETPPETVELQEILKKSAELHEHLRNYGQLGDSEKPLVVSAILLALRENPNIADSLRGDLVKTDGSVIFDALSTHMTRVDVKPETKKEQVLSQFNIVKNRTILNQVDERLQKTPLKYFTEYLKSNVYSSVVANTKEDVLGRFYGQFIRYSGGDGQTLGVVLTPSHITELFCDLIDLKPEDIVFDPTCGTGGFLITAMHKMIEQADKSEAEKIKKDRIHGIEIREDMFSIATTNMILRGDGKSNLLKDDFLRRSVESMRANNYSVGLMNPPYSQAKSKDTSYLSEIHFIEHLLDGLADNGRAVVIVPQSTMVGNTSEDKQVKKRILKKHTLEGVITLNKNTFYGVGTNVCIAVFTAHLPHNPQKFCKFINFDDDGFVVSKHIGLIETERAKEKKAHLLSCWLYDAPSDSKFMVKTIINPDDEWLHSFYYFNDEIPREEDFKQTMGAYLGFEFNMIMQGKDYLFSGSEFNQNITDPNLSDLSSRIWKEFSIGELFQISKGKYLAQNKIIRGEIPYITAKSENNGLNDFIGNNPLFEAGCITIEKVSLSAFFQPHKFYCSHDVTVIQNRYLNKYNGLFICNMINRQSSKYSYGRQAQLNVVKSEKVFLPVNSDNLPDFDFMENYMKKLEYSSLEQYQHYKKS